MNKREKNNRNKKTAAEIAGKVTKIVVFTVAGIAVSIFAPKLGEKLLNNGGDA